MTPTITVNPAPVDGVFCSNIEYEFTVDCPGARSIKWYGQSAPPGFNASDVQFSADQQFTTLVTFPFTGQWLVNVDCALLA